MNGKTGSIGQLDLLRIGLLGVAAVSFKAGADLWAQGQPALYPLALLASFVAWAGGVAAGVLALTTRPPHWSRWLILGTLLFAQLAYAHLGNLNAAPLVVNRTDNEMIARFAVETLLRGENPYTWNYTDILRVFGDRGVNVTPFLDGAFQYRLTYPALPTLLLAGFRWLGIADVRAVSLLFQLLLLLFLFTGAPERLRPVVLLPLFLLKDLVFMTANGVQDVVWSVLLCAMILCWKRPTWRAVFFGLAAAYRQQPWIVAPFLLIELWNEPGAPGARWRRLAWFVAVGGAVFLFVNLPFIVWDPRSWWLGALEPAYARFNSYGWGLAALSSFGLVDLPRSFYTLLQLSSLVALATIHWRHPRMVGQAFWLFPALFFWLYYRSLANYWVYWLPPLLLAVTAGMTEPIFKAAGRAGAERRIETKAPMATARAASNRTCGPTRPALAGIFQVEQATAPPAWRGTLAVLLLLAVANGLAGLALVLRPPAVAVDVDLPLEVIDYGNQLVTRLQVDVTNNGEQPLEPRFAVQHDPGVQALPWQIERGPRQLLPGQSARYTIDARVPVRAFPVERGGQLVVSAASLDYAQRAVATIPAETSFARPDWIVNPRYTVWPRDGAVPEGWELSAANGTATARLDHVAGQTALLLYLVRDSDAVESADLRLSQTIVVPAMFDAWVYPLLPADTSCQQGMGFEFDDGALVLRVLVGGDEPLTRQDGTTACVILPAPLGRWSRQTIDLPALYARFDWPLPPVTPRYCNGLDYAAVQTRMSLLVALYSRTLALGTFGPLEQDEGAVSTAAEVERTFARPDVYYVALGDAYRQQRNHDLARSAYERALTYNALSAEAHFGLAEADFWLGDWPGALVAFETSIRYGYYQPALAYRGIGWACYNLGQDEAASAAFEQALQLAPQLADAHNGLGWLALRQGRCEQARGHFERALELAPGFSEAQTGLERCTEP